MSGTRRSMSSLLSHSRSEARSNISTASTDVWSRSTACGWVRWGWGCTAAGKGVSVSSGRRVDHLAPQRVGSSREASGSRLLKNAEPSKACLLSVNMQLPQAAAARPGQPAKQPEQPRTRGALAGGHDVGEDDECGRLVRPLGHGVVRHAAHEAQRALAANHEALDDLNGVVGGEVHLARGQGTRARVWGGWRGAGGAQVVWARLLLGSPALGVSCSHLPTRCCIRAGSQELTSAFSE